ncbi:unnamed protein product [Caenorhabditis auriculariae]|uniref:Serine/threonine-protein phosphatase 4 regulatory subunit 3-like central domain-containing protein n=1 Tax=Caenorhabditis auriculariae TaxID=2777116 RepID=A0A8S1HK78_9PELO|nr:unnamed protein product [Caenorhabditis auriculariae]
MSDSQRDSGSPTAEEKPKENSTTKETKEAKETKENEKVEKKTDSKSTEKAKVNGSAKDKEKDKDDIQRIGKPNKRHFLDHIEIQREALNRVKLYVLCEQRVWDDRGTGHVMCISANDEEEPQNSSSFVIVVRLEAQDKNVLESRILMDTVYQKQQETLIVWSESDTCDLALSFQDKSGCEEIWAKICEVQGRDPGDSDAAYEDLDDSDTAELSTTTSRMTLPPIEIGRLSELESLLQLHLSTSSMREKIANAIENEDTLPKLCELFQMCEDLEHTEGLKTFYSIAKNLFMLNRTSLNELLVDDRFMKDLIGMLEYDPSFDTPRKHREFVYDKAKFREVLRISSDELIDKIHKTYRVQYIQDVCLPSMGLFEENLLSALNSYIFFSRVDIVTLLQKDKRLMKELFEHLRDPNTSVERRKELALFLKEFITLSQGLPPSGAQSKENFFKNLQTNDVLGTIEPCLKSPDVETRAAMVGMLSLLVEHNPQLVRDYMIKQAKDKEEGDILLNRVIVHMLNDKDPDLTTGSQAALMLKILLDPDNMVTMKAERSEFLQMFYTKSIQTMIKPILENTEGRVLKRDDYVTANRQSLIVRLLYFCIEHHSYAMRQFCINTDLLNSVLVLLQSKHTFLSIFALKMIRRVISKKDEFYYRHIVREKVLDPVFECFKRNGSRYNLMNSVMLNLFDLIKTEDIKMLCKYIVENHSDVIESVTYVKVLSDLKLRYEQNKDREETSSTRSDDRSAASSPRSYKKERQEEQWFDEDDDDDEPVDFKKDVVKKEDTPRKTGIEPMFPSVLKRKNAVDEDDLSVFETGSLSTVLMPKKIVIKVNSERSRTPSPASPRESASPAKSPIREDEVSSSQSTKENSPALTVKSLVDYDESDSDDEEEASPDAMPSSSTGSPVQEEGSGDKKTNDVNSPEHSDVSSSTNENGDGNKSPPDGEQKTEKTEPPDATTELRRANKRHSSGDQDPLEAKRHRSEEGVSEA